MQAVHLILELMEGTKPGSLGFKCFRDREQKIEQSAKRSLLAVYKDLVDGGQLVRPGTDMAVRMVGSKTGMGSLRFARVDHLYLRTANGPVDLAKPPKALECALSFYVDNPDGEGLLHGPDVGAKVDLMRYHASKHVLGVALISSPSARTGCIISPLAITEKARRRPIQSPSRPFSGP